MKAFKKIFAAVIVMIVLIFAGANLFLASFGREESGRPYRVEINRLALEIEKSGLENIDLSICDFVDHIEKCGESFYDSDSDYIIKEIGGDLYRFDYSVKNNTDKNMITAAVNIILGIVSALMLMVMLFVRQKILMPFEKMTEVPYELSRGNLTAPIKESKNRFFGRFVWGMDLLRENVEQQKQRELKLQKDKKTLLLSLSHDLKTPLSAIKLYSKALSKGLYADKERQLEVAENINEKADEIEGYVSQIISASREEFLSLDVKMGVFYLSALADEIKLYYTDKLDLIKTEFEVGKYNNCLLKGDPDRSVEVFQNIMENAVKYGDGRSISVTFSEEDGCILITVKNSGCMLSDTEIPHIFESFWRGSNAGNEKGSGLGLYICRQLMHKMNGEVFAETENGNMLVTMVFSKA
ncbi:MAG: sensor histidine kinase [Porcipelethomonas sp.]